MLPDPLQRAADQLLANSRTAAPPHPAVTALLVRHRGFTMKVQPTGPEPTAGSSGRLTVIIDLAEHEADEPASDLLVLDGEPDQLLALLDGAADEAEDSGVLPDDDGAEFEVVDPLRSVEDLQHLIGVDDETLARARQHVAAIVAQNEADDVAPEQAAEVAP